jgi:HAD superfamily hydrolase (TIGR01509 family)
VAEALVERFAAGTAPAELGARKRLAYRALAASLAPSPGVADALAEQRLRAALVSSSSRADVELLVRGSPLEPLLEVVVTGDDVAAPKPAPDGYLLALRRLGVPPAGCVAVEDSRCGVEAAVAAGLRVVAVAALEPPPPGATWWCPTSAEAIRLAGAAVASYSPICFA